MIITGGLNVYPREVEIVLEEHPSVAEVAVAGVPHERWGEQVTAWVVMREGHGFEERHQRSRGVGQRHQHSAVHNAAGGAQVRRPVQPRDHPIGAGLLQDQVKLPGERHKRDQGVQVSGHDQSLLRHGLAVLGFNDLALPQLRSPPDRRRARSR